MTHDRPNTLRRSVTAHKEALNLALREKSDGGAGAAIGIGGPGGAGADARVATPSRTVLDTSIAAAEQFRARTTSNPLFSSLRLNPYCKTISAKSKAPRSWSPAFAFIINLLRHQIALVADNVTHARLLTEHVAFPCPWYVHFTKIYIPFRPGLYIKEAGGCPPDAKQMKAEWTDFKALPTREKPAERVIILIHGGAFFSCQRKTHRGVAWRLAKYADARVLSIDYRLSPECSFPDPIAEVLNAYAYLIDPPHPKLPKYRPDQITLCGDSAGGNLATAAVLWIRDHPGRLPMPAGLIGLSPWLDLLGSQPSWLVNAPFDFLPNGSHDKRYVNADRSHYYVKSNQYLAHPLCSPLFNHELPNAPICPTFITVGTVERLRDEAIVFAYAQFPNSPISIDLLEDMPHVSQIFAGMEKLPRQSLKRVGAWVKLVCGPNRTIPSRKCTLLRNDRKVTALNVPNPMAIVEHSWQVVGKYGIARLTRENAEIQKGALEYGLSVGETRRKGSVLKAFTID